MHNIALSVPADVPVEVLLRCAGRRSDAFNNLHEHVTVENTAQEARTQEQWPCWICGILRPMPLHVLCEHNESDRHRSVLRVCALTQSGEASTAAV